MSTAIKKIIIIGASSGIGHRIASDFARAGLQIGIAARSEQKLRHLSEQYPDNIVYKTIDVTDHDCEKLLYDLIEMRGGMDILLYASGVGSINPQLDIDTDIHTVSTNVDGFVRIVNAAYRYFRSTATPNAGQIAVITSLARTKGIGIAASYSSSKRFQSTYIDALDQLAHHQHVNVHFTDIRPGFIRTPLLHDNHRFPMEMTLDYAAPLIEKAILQRKRVAVIDSRWRIVAALWGIIPQWIWHRIALEPRRIPTTQQTKS
ncbi:MAG: SDR family NAD(P)-dependent oxidoreductase [Muribaculaceae bacterium]|nr:SDR family NAD(P)-dependent oxidoreductase [Muribaculaceae bacterium]